MKKKSKLVVFLLSLIPGLGHFYLGLMNRGLIFLGAVVANAVLVATLVILSRVDDFLVLLIGLPVIWFLALVDSMMSTDRVNGNINEHYEESDSEDLELMKAEEKEGIKKDMNIQNKKLLTCLFSFIPGAGHMYLGYKRQGLGLMSLFFFSFFFIDWLRISFFMFVIPVIWFYSMFDALDKATGTDGKKVEEDIFIPDAFKFNKPKKCDWNGSKLLGYALVGIGILLIFDRIISPLISYQLRNHLQTGIVAVLFIFGGIKILMGGKRDKEEVKEEETKEVEEHCADGE